MSDEIYSSTVGVGSETFTFAKLGETMYLVKHTKPIPASWEFGRHRDGFKGIVQTEAGVYVSKVIGGEVFYLHPDGMYRTSAVTDVNGVQSRAYFPDILTAILRYLQVEYDVLRSEV